eukprot:TRINITY_DN15224_c0_g1_i1.p1 TRINITY_DN15224_c0_g1~~TRINITY_DN15224_c0_g1_i1.p1  ORF type:complete len:260 (-),score=37.91 TRINITY_DN15224_c0_g1_i1:53-832(-)
MRVSSFCISTIVLLCFLGLCVADVTLQWEIYQLGNTYVQNSTEQTCPSTPVRITNIPNCTLSTNATDPDPTYDAFVCNADSEITLLSCADSACGNCEVVVNFTSGQCLAFDDLFQYAQKFSCATTIPKLSSTSVTLYLSTDINKANNCQPARVYQVEPDKCGYALSVSKCSGQTGRTNVSFCPAADCTPIQGEDCLVYDIDPNESCRSIPTAGYTFDVDIPVCVLDPPSGTGYANTSGAVHMTAVSGAVALSALAVGLL